MDSCCRRSGCNGFLNCGRSKVRALPNISPHDSADVGCGYSAMAAPAYANANIIKSFKSWCSSIGGRGMITKMKRGKRCYPSIFTSVPYVGCRRMNLLLTTGGVRVDPFCAYLMLLPVRFAIYLTPALVLSQPDPNVHLLFCYVTLRLQQALTRRQSFSLQLFP